MCGLAGVIRLRAAGPPETAVRAALASLAHRGPDAQGVRREGPCTLLHTRLRILDLDPRADQPMERRARGRGRAGEDDRIVMLYNGEVYNFRALRSELAADGWQFTTTSDAEVLLVGYAAWGLDVLRRARGMCACQRRSRLATVPSKARPSNAARRARSFAGSGEGSDAR